MSGASVFIIFLAVLLIAARLLLRPERRPPVPASQKAEGIPRMDRPIGTRPTTLEPSNNRRFLKLSAPSGGPQKRLSHSLRDACSHFTGGSTSASLRIGLDASLSYGPLRNVLARLQKTEPAIDVRFVEGDDDDIVDQVARGTIDVAFIQERVDNASIVSEHCWNETIVVALPEGHRLAGHHALHREALRCETFLMAIDETRVIRTANEIATILEGRPRLIIPTQVHRDTLMHLVGLGFGIALTRSCALGVYYPGVIYRPISAPEPHAAVYAIWRPETLSPEASVLLAYAQAEGRQGAVE